jgi:predicted DNA-binding protein YlxM (UPF0122 family)
MTKKMLPVPTRLAPEILARLQQISDERGISISELIREGMNVYLSGDNSLSGMAHRVNQLEKNVFNLVETMRTFVEATNRNFDMSREKERVRLQAIVDLIKSKIDEHDKAEKLRFGELSKYQYAVRL